jgi:CheY-like chemotaxis protein
MTSGMDMKDQCLNAGANGFIMKPFMPDELIKKLRG